MTTYPRSLNPFLDDDAASISSVASFFSTTSPPSYPLPPPPPRVIQQNIKLPPFWNDAPVAWFVAAEAQFELRHVDSQKERFCHVTTALDKLSLKKIVHLVANPDPILPYTRLKEALLASHVLTDFQRVELLLAVEPLGGRKPSELLADMWELCPDNQHNSIFFAALFLQRLPREIRVMLSHEDHSDLRHLAAHADRLIAFGGRQEPVSCAVELHQDDVVAAIQQKGKQQSKNRTGARRSCPSHRRYRPATTAARAASTRRQIPHPLQWPGKPQDCASTTGLLEIRHIPARLLAPGRETRPLGCRRCHQPQQSSPHGGQHQWHLFPS